MIILGTCLVVIVVVAASKIYVRSRLDSLMEFLKEFFTVFLRFSYSKLLLHLRDPKIDEPPPADNAKLQLSCKLTTQRYSTRLMAK